jgi:hypothetical protein
MNSTSGKASTMVAAIGLIGVLGSAIISKADAFESGYQGVSSLKTLQDHSIPATLESRKNTPTVTDPEPTSQPPARPRSEPNVSKEVMGDRRSSELYGSPPSFQSTGIAQSTVLTQQPLSTRRKLPSRGFSGTWNGSGYQCEGRAHEEIIDIRFEDNFLIATKIDAADDKCVPTGARTFSAQVPKFVSEGSAYPVIFTVGSPSNPASVRMAGGA